MTLLTGSANCIKYVLFAFNFVFVLTGILLISVGVTVAGVYSKYELFLISKFFSVPTFLIVIGAFIFVIAFFGCCGAIKENYCMILTFTVLLVLIFIFELAAGISGYVLRNEANDLIKDHLIETMPNYNVTGKEDITRLWDLVQRDFTCCGTNNYTDWSLPKVNKSLPLSCCEIPDGVSFYQCTASTDNDNLHRLGCVPQFGKFISAHALSLGAAGIVLAVIQFAGIFFACYVAREIKIRNGGTGLF